MREQAELGASQERQLQNARTIARWLDARYLDPLLGLLVPGVGDLATAGLGLYLVLAAVRRRLPALVIVRMLLNLGFDAILGSLPVLGDLFDLAFRANQKNLAILEARYETGRYTAGDLAVVSGALLLLLGALAIPATLVFMLLRAAFT